MKKALVGLGLVGLLGCSSRGTEIGGNKPAEPKPLKDWIFASSQEPYDLKMGASKQYRVFNTHLPREQWKTITHHLNPGFHFYADKDKLVMVERCQMFGKNWPGEHGGNVSTFWFDCERLDPNPDLDNLFNIVLTHYVDTVSAKLEEDFLAAYEKVKGEKIGFPSQAMLDADKIKYISAHAVQALKAGEYFFTVEAKSYHGELNLEYTLNHKEDFRVREPLPVPLPVNAAATEGFFFKFKDHLSLGKISDLEVCYSESCTNGLCTFKDYTCEPMKANLEAAENIHNWMLGNFSLAIDRKKIDLNPDFTAAYEQLKKEIPPSVKEKLK